MDTAPVIELAGVCKTYHSGEVTTPVLFDISFRIRRGEFVAIVGGSGSGKTTLLNIMGLLDRPSSGQVLVEGREAGGLDELGRAEVRRERLGFIFQFHYLLPEFTAYENVLMPVRIAGTPITDEIRARADELMALVGLTKVKDNLAVNMSGGQQQRTAIARALMNRPEIILADEPTGNLDSDTTEQVYDLLREINRKYKTTFVIITHDRRIAEKADRIVEVKDGKIRLDIRK